MELMSNGFGGGVVVSVGGGFPVEEVLLQAENTRQAKTIQPLFDKRKSKPLFTARGLAGQNEGNW